MAKIQLSPRQKEFQKMKRFVQKRFPGATTKANGDGTYSVVDAYGLEVRNEELLFPPANTVWEAWHQAKYSHWFTNMIRKSNNAFNEEKIYKAIAKESGE
jgi:hypothetical protein